MPNKHVSSFQDWTKHWDWFLKCVVCHLMMFSDLIKLKSNQIKNPLSKLCLSLAVTLFFPFKARPSPGTLLRLLSPLLSSEFQTQGGLFDPFLSFTLAISIFCPNTSK